MEVHHPRLVEILTHQVENEEQVQVEEVLLGLVPEIAMAVAVAVVVHHPHLVEILILQEENEEEEVLLVVVVEVEVHHPRLVVILTH